ncbi:MAG: hypothetical protein ABIY50_00085 [Ignavibacteria bacterium]
MKTLLSAFVILLLSLILSSCNGARFDSIDKQLTSIDSVMRHHDDCQSQEKGISFHKDSPLIVKFKLVYTLKNNIEISEVITFPSSSSGFYFKSFLRDCDTNKFKSIPKFYIIRDEAGMTPYEIQADNMAHTIDIEQPDLSPGQTRQLKIIINESRHVKVKNPCNHPCGEKLMGRTVFTVEMN